MRRQTQDSPDSPDAGRAGRAIYEILQAAKVAVPALASAGTDPNAAGGPRDLAVFDHEYLSDPEKVVDMQVVFVRWEEMDGLGGCVAGPRSATAGAASARHPRPPARRGRERKRIAQTAERQERLS